MKDVEYVIDDFDNDADDEDMAIETFVNSDWGSALGYFNGLGANLLHIAVESKNIKLVDETIKMGADVNNTDLYGNTALFKCNCAEIIHKLLNSGCDPNLRNKQNEAAINMYLYKSELFHILAPITNLDEKCGTFTILQYLIQNINTDCGTISEAIKYTKDLDVVDSKNRSLLHMAAVKQKYWSVIDLLISSGVNLYLKNDEGKDFYDLCFKGVQTMIKKKYPDFIKNKEINDDAEKYNL